MTATALGVDGHDGRVRHRALLAKTVLDLLERDAAARDLHDPVCAAEMGEAPVGVESNEVGGFEGPWEVRVEIVGVDGEAAASARRDAHAFEGSPRTRRLLVALAQGDAAGLGRAEDLGDREPMAFAKIPRHRIRQRTRRRDDAAEPRERPAAQGRERPQLDRHRHEHTRAVLYHAVGDRLGVVGRLASEGGAGDEGYEQRKMAAVDVDRRDAADEAVPGPDREAAREGMGLAEERTARLRRAQHRARRARREDRRDHAGVGYEGDREGRAAVAGRQQVGQAKRESRIGVVEQGHRLGPPMDGQDRVPPQVGGKRDRVPPLEGPEQRRRDRVSVAPRDEQDVGAR